MARNHQSIRVFDNSILEALTHVHPITPLLMWSPIVIYLTYLALFVQQLSLLAMISWAFIGVIVWTLMEYVVHRYAFHFPAKSKLTKRFVFLFHGIHHDEPNDPTRLVMPPVPGLLIMGLLYTLFQMIIPGQYINIFMASFIISYLAYDYIHYATHHFPMTSKVGRYLKKYHLQHHYTDGPYKYGVSNPLWDYVFNTVGPKKGR